MKVPIELVSEIPLVGKNAEGRVAMINFDDYDLRGFRWKYNPKTGYAFTHVGTEIVYLHRFVASRMGLDLDPKVVDHIDGDRLNNCRSNLRSATRSENAMNRRKQKNNTSGRVGVYQLPNGKWNPQIKVNGKTKSLGRYDEFEEACRVREMAEKEYFGDFAPKF